MRNVAFVVVALGIVACSTPRPTVIDGGVTGTDAGTPPGNDAGMPGHDAAMTTGGCGLTVSATGVIGSLTGTACFPRCSMATRTQYNACAMMTDPMARQNCVTAALMADTTAGIPWTQDGMAAMNPLNCRTCYNIQQLHCISANGCATQVTAYLQCNPMTDPGMCASQVMAVNSCAMTNQTAIRACLGDATMGIAACFG